MTKYTCYERFGNLVSIQSYDRVFNLRSIFLVEKWDHLAEKPIEFYMDSGKSRCADYTYMQEHTSFPLKQQIIYFGKCLWFFGFFFISSFPATVL